MGAQTSTVQEIGELQGKIQQQALTIKEIAFLTHADFVKAIQNLNKISQTFSHGSGQRLVFAVKRGTDETLLWKATVKVACVKADAATSKIESYRLLNLKQFLVVYKMIVYQATAHSHTLPGNNSTATTSTFASETPVPLPADTPEDGHCVANSHDAVVCEAAENAMWGQPVTASLIMEKLAMVGISPEKYDECCICMDRKPEIILPCAHNYCLVCIEQWNVSHKTCPVCREAVESTEDSWVISEAPNSEEMAAEIQKCLIGLVDKQGSDVT